MELAIIAIVVIVLTTLVVGGWLWSQQKKDTNLRDKFGDEYYRVREREGTRGDTKAELERREHRVERYDIRPLTEDESLGFIDRWRRIQTEFVDAPADSVMRADTLVAEVMAARGYPMEDFEGRAQDLSVDHPELVQNYREAHRIAEADRRGDATTDDLRQAFVHYRDLFEDLLDTRQVSTQGASR